LCRSATAVFIAELEGKLELNLILQPVHCLSKIKGAEALCRSATAVFSAEIEGTVELYLYCRASTMNFKD
jgi:hypothetical protein